MENKKLWTPFKIWNETQWFTDIDMLIKEFKRNRKKRLINNFWRKGGKK